MIKNLFKKDINRQIEGVIKADNLGSEVVFNEVDEYVITKELEKRLEDFFAEYSSTIGVPTQNIGCWISGHFGSGKSHLLKILSYILSNNEKYDNLIKELFLGKIDDNKLKLKEDIEKALNNKSDTILFNIEHKVDSSANSKDSILDVFVKVFNEFNGYYAKTPYIAKFEKDLDRRGKFELFKKRFKEVSGESWESGREVILLENDNLAKVLNEIDDISFESAKDIINKYETDYSLSIEDFSKEVKEFISKKDKNYRLIFCIDEVGQFIGDNTKLMLSLQTIVESLAVECKGQVWVITTSQSAVDEILNSNLRVENDFSKILGRFKIKLNLTSQNATEVIQKRILEKKDEVKGDLSAIYIKIENSLKSILRFEGQTRNYKSFSNSEEFISWYPFIPYQLELFQSTIKSLSAHNVFQGRHQSTGERSMLDVVQQITQELSNENIGKFVTFDKFYDGISSIIKAEYQTDINRAEEILDFFTFKVLKTLFLIKYIQEFESNLNNITILLIDNVNVNFSEIKDKVKISLNRLVQNSYIQKVGNRYDYLTNIEKDIQQEIKLVEVTELDVNSKLMDWIYGDIIKMNKVQNYNFSQKIDSVLKGKEFELSLNIIVNEKDDIYRISIGSDDLIFYAPLDFELEQEIEEFIRIERYIPQRNSQNLSYQEIAVLNNRREENIKRREYIFSSLKEILSESDIYYNGDIIDINSKDIKNRVNDGFKVVIDSIYPYLKQLPKKYDENEIKSILSNNDLLKEEDSLAIYEMELLNRINKHTPLKEIIDVFSKRPYGFYREAILSIVATLRAKELIEIKEYSVPLTREELTSKLINTRFDDKLLLNKKQEIDSKKFRKVKGILKEIFGVELANEDEVYKDFKERVNERIFKLQKGNNYPIKNRTQQLIDYLKNLPMNDDFFDFIIDNEDELIDTFEEIDEFIEFLEGRQSKIYDDVKTFFDINRDNLKYVGDVDLTILYKEDFYKKISKINTLYETTKSKIDEILKIEKEKAVKKIDEIIEEINNLEEFKKVEIGKRAEIIKPIDNLKNKVNSSIGIDSVKQSVDRDEIIKKAYEKISEFIEDDIETKSISDLIPKIRIKSKDDVEEFIDILRNKLLNELDNNVKIVI